MTGEIVDTSEYRDYDGIVAWLRGKVASLVGCAADALSDTDSFGTIGLDSVRAVSLAQALTEWTGRTWSPTVAWACPTIQSLARRILAPAGGDEDDRPGAAPEAHDRRYGEPIAVVGLACRFPGANDVEGFWRLLESGTDAVSAVPAERREANPLKGTSVASAGLLDGPVDGFDPLFFDISPREASEMDPQQRLFLEVAWEALEDASIPKSRLADSDTGVFAGAIWHDYADLARRRPGEITPHSATGQALNMVANRLSYVLGLRGPSVVLDSACSSSLLAVHLACQSIWAGESSLAIAGGVNLMLNAATTVSLDLLGGLSPTGRCRSFDARADGFVRGEGCGVVVLKPLRLALADGDDIWCVVRGSATNNDGLSNGLTAPSPIAQEEVLRAAYRRAGISPADVHYVETHGTGTPLGDPIEAMALGAVLGRNRPTDPAAALRIGSAKTNLGHLEAAAGIAGLIKTALALKHRAVPRSLHFETPNPRIPFDDLRLRVTTETEPWPESAFPYAGVSAFGWGGTNVHVVLAGWDEPAPLPPLPPAGQDAARKPRVAFVFSPYGQHWVGMGRRLYRTEPVFRSVLRRCDQELSRYVDWSLVEELFLDEPRARTGDVEVVQPLVFAIQVGLAAWFEAAGVRPGAVVGHSLGEIAACTVAGVLDLPDAVYLVHHYSDQQRRMAGMGAGGMAVVELPAEDILERLAGLSVSIAARNGPRATVLSGDRSDLTAGLSVLKAEGIQCAMIDIEAAVHSPAVEPIMADLERKIGKLTPKPGRLPVISSVTGAPLDWRQAGPAYFPRNLRQEVLFTDAIAHLLDRDYDVLLEISASPVLASALRQSVGEHRNAATVLTSMRRDEDDRAGLVETLHLLRRLGAAVHLPSAPGQARSELVTLSACSTEALRDLAGKVAADLDTPAEAGPNKDLPALARTALRRAHHPYRLSLTARGEPEVAEALAAYARGERPAGLAVSGRAVRKAPKVAFVFPGQGAQWIGMGTELLRSQPVFGAAVRACDEAAQPFQQWSIETELLAGEQRSRLDRVEVIHPLLFTIAVALARLWRSWGIEPDAVIGHSMGEIAAACVAGALSLGDAARVVCRRSQLLRRISGKGAMLVVELGADDARAVIRGHESVVSVAVSNSPRSTVLSGDPGALGEIAGRLERDGVFCRRVNVDCAGHSPQMDALRPDLLDAFGDLAPRSNDVSFYSTVTGTVIEGTAMTGTYWADNLREPVRFGDQIASLMADGFTAFVEMSPHPLLLTAVEEIAAHRGDEVTAVPSMRRGVDARGTLLESLGRLHVLGVPARIEDALTPGHHGRKLPHYPWQRERFWFGDADAETPSPAAKSTVSPLLLGERIDPVLQPGVHYWQSNFDAGTASLGDHRLGGTVVFPGTCFVDMALTAAGQVLPGNHHVPSDIVFPRPLTFTGENARRVQAVLEPAGARRARMRLFAVDGPEPVCVAEALLSTVDELSVVERLDVAKINERMSEFLDGGDYYRTLAARGIDYGPAFQGIKRISRAEGESLALVRLDTEAMALCQGVHLHPALMDSALQAALAPLLGAGWGEAGHGWLLSEGLGRVVVRGPLAGEMWAHAVCHRTEPRRWAADVRLVDPEGTCLAEVTGLRVIELESIPLARPASGRKPSRRVAVAGGDAPAEAGRITARETIAALPRGPERGAALESTVRDVVAQVVKLPAHRVDADCPLRSLGIDSAMSLELRNHLERSFGVQLSATIVWNYPTVRDLTGFLVAKLGLAAGRETGTPAEVPVDTAPAGEGQRDQTGSPEEILQRELTELAERMEFL